MRTWDDWSDGDLSEAVAALHVGGRKFTRREKDTGVGCFGSSGNYIGDFDINNWADMGPLLFKNHISIMQPDEGDELWNAIHWCDGGECMYDEYHKSPLRAAAIVFLVMNGVKP